MSHDIIYENLLDTNYKIISLSGLGTPKGIPKILLCLCVIQVLSISIEFAASWSLKLRNTVTKTNNKLITPFNVSMYVSFIYGDITKKNLDDTLICSLLIVDY